MPIKVPERVPSTQAIVSSGTAVFLLVTKEACSTTLTCRLHIPCIMPKQAMREGIRPDGSKYIRKGPPADQVWYNTVHNLHWWAEQLVLTLPRRPLQYCCDWPAAMKS